MKKRVEEHRIRCERSQYAKLYSRYEDFSWGTIDNEISVKLPEFHRRYKKLVKHLYGKKFRSFLKAVRYDDIRWENHRGYGE